MQTAIDAVQYVGQANYDNRERAALQAIRFSAETGRYADPEEFDK